MMAALWTAVSVVGLWLVVVWAFVSAMHARAIMSRGERIHWLFLAALVPLAIVGYIGDLVFNLTIGCLIFREGWRKPTFSQRCYYHKHHGDGWRRQRAIWWCAELNRFDPSHC